jgi:hypothetical protein
MGEPKTRCSSCGREILASTAQKRGGQCVPCSNGTRAQIDAGREWYREQKAFEASPVWQFWLQLNGSDFSTLRREERLYYAVNCLRGDVLNGGFVSFFHNYSPLYSLAEEGLAELGATTSLRLLREAKLCVFGELMAPDRGREVIDSLEDVGRSAKLDQLSRDFCADADGLWDKLQGFGVRCGFYSEVWRSRRVD